jgi:fucose 4-O-acetylase-like acetyltransferase
MVTLMLVSGYLAYSSSRTIDMNWIKNRAKRLLIPWAAWGIIMNIFYILTRQRQWEDINFNIFSYTIWFLGSLFLNSLLLWLALQIISRIKASKGEDAVLMFVLLGMDLMLKLLSLKVDYCIIVLSSWHITFFFVGYVIHRYQQYLKRWYAAVAVGVFGILHMILSSYEVNYVIMKADDYAYAFFLIAVFFCITSVLPAKIKALSSFIAKNSMYIYILHIFLLLQFTPNVYINILLASVGGVVLPLVVAHLIHKYGCRMKVLFGE